VSFHPLEIRKDVSRKTRILLAFLSWGLIVLLWFMLTKWGNLPPFSLPRPMGVVAAFARLWTEYDLLGNVFMSWWRIAQAFLWSAAIAIPLGLLMGSFRWLHSFINPIAEPMRSMPITAFIPAFIGLFGMEEGMKVGFLFFGMFFYLLALVVEEADRVDQSLLETAMTLGAKKPQLLWLMFRASFPAIFGSFRILYDIGWT
jgi:NitT/TauT family transport system permease protein